MEEPSPIILSPCSSGRRSNDSKSPEFEFWMVRNPSFPQPDLHSADELFSGGILLPLDHIHHTQLETSGSDQTQKPDPKPETDPSNLSAAPALTSSKRWTSIFRKSENDVVVVEKGKNVKEKKREKKNGGPAVSGTELNINIWPFSRSRSAGNGGTRPKLGGISAETRRKVSSAPCSRSNSAGESKSRKCPNSPNRVAGVHVGKASPVWQLRRGAAVTAATSTASKNSNGKSKSVEKGVRNGESESRLKNSTAAVNSGRSGGASGGGVKNKVLSLNVPMCIGYRHQLSCRSDENSAIGIAAGVAATGGGGGEAGRGGNFFNIKGLFSKKVY